MAAKIMVRCPRCRGRFEWKGKFPSQCPLPNCDYEASESDDAVICMPALRGAAMKANDKVYRDIEKGSEVRAQMAAEMAGVPVSEMSGLKVTNMRDNVREGETYAMPVANEVTKQMDTIRRNGGSAGFDGKAQEWARQAQSQAPRAGMNASDAVNAAFQKLDGSLRSNMNRRGRFQ